MTDTTSKMTVLFVEDAPELRKEMQEILTQEGFIMLEAADGEEALAIARKEHPDLILLDLILPRGGGFDLLSAFQSNEELSIIPIVVLTNLDGAEHIERAFELGARAYLVKAHYTLPDIVQHIRPYLPAQS